MRLTSAFLTFGLVLTSLCVSRGARAADCPPTQERLITAVFDTRAAALELDANGDGRLSVADALLLPPGDDPGCPTPTFLPTSTPTQPPPPTATSSPTLTTTRRLRPTATPSPSETATALPTVTETWSPTATMPTPTVTHTPTTSPTVTPTGLIWDGTLIELVPHGTGDTLIYRVTGTDTPTMETTEVISNDGAGNFVVEVKRGMVHEQQFYHDAGGLLRYTGVTDIPRNTRTSCAPGAIRIAAPLHVGDFFETTSTCEIRLISPSVFLGSFTLIETVTAVEVVESVTVPAGTYFNAVRITQTSTLGMETNDVHLAAGVGVVRRLVMSNTGTRLRELVDGTVNGQSVKR